MLGRGSRLPIAQEISTAATDGLRVLTGRITCDKDPRTSHTVVRVQNLAADDALCFGIAAYVVALRARSIDVALRIRQAALPDGPATSADLLSDIRKMCGVDPVPTDLALFKLNQRNPWLSECFTHMLMHAASVHPDTHAPGAVLGAWTAHTRPNDPGLDVATLYRRDGSLGIGILETKACENSAPAAVQDATRYFQEVDAGEHSDRLRQAVDMLASALDAKEAATLPLMLWRDERAYIANPQYEIDLPGTSWKARRPTLAALEPDCDRIVILACPIDDFQGFFDRLAASAVQFTEGL
jgi:hypothetical protein